MSDLFLDTEVRWNVPFVARRCAESGYDNGTLDRIFWAEVFPEAIGNMLQVAGEWTALALNEAALISRANAGSMPWLRRLLFGWMVKSEWHGTCAVTQWLRPLDEPRRKHFVNALHLCGRLYFERPGALSASTSWLEEMVDDVYEVRTDAMREVLADAWQRYEPVCRLMLGDNETPTRDARAAAVRKRYALDVTR